MDSPAEQGYPFLHIVSNQVSLPPLFFIFYIHDSLMVSSLSDWENAFKIQLTIKHREQAPYSLLLCNGVR